MRGNIDIRQSKEYAKHLANLGWIVERESGVNYFSKKLPIIGHVLKVQRPEKINYKYIDAFIQGNRVFQVVIEPKTKSQARQLLNRGYRLSKSPYLPTKTQILKLTSDKILSKSFKKKTRYSIKKASSLKLYQNPPIADFHASWKRQAQFSRYVPSISTLKSLEASFGINMLVLASHNDINEQKKFSAGSIFLKSGSTIYYWQSFSGPLGRSTLAQYAIVWRGILWGITKRAKYLDFEGIYDARFPNKRWLGFSHFKKQFGGESFVYPGCFVKYYWRH